MLRMNPAPDLGDYSVGAKDRLPALDGLRGIAALCVLFDHIGLLTKFPQFAQHGAISVDLFFMISGFVMAHAYEARFESMTLRGFGGQRLARLYPAIALSIGLSALVAFTVPSVAPKVDASGWLLHVLLLPSLTGHETFPVNPVFWSLFFELFANACHWRFFRLSAFGVAIVTGVCGALFIGASVYFGGAGVGAHAFDFPAGFVRVGWGYGVGVLLFRFLQAPVFRVPRVNVSLLFLLCVVFLFAPPFAGKLRIVFPLFVGFPLLVLLGARARLSVAWVERPATWLGDISYPLYAIHWPLLVIAVYALDGSASLVAWTAVIVIIIGLATATEYAFDAPVRNWLKARSGRRRAASLSR